MREMRTAGIGLILAAALAAPAYAAGPYITARAAIIIDAATGEVVWERNSTEPLPPASTTKVMTAILALESGRLDESFRVSENAAETPPSGIHLRAGQRMRLKNLLYAVLLNSANDAAEVVAEGLAGSEEVFAAHMTARARELGASTAHFANPHGLTAPGHEASARDLALIFRHGLAVPLFPYGFGEGPPVVMARAATRRHGGLVRHVAARPVRSEGDDDVTADPRIARYAVRLGPYRSQQVALATRSRLAQRGYRVVLAGRTLRIGSFTNVSKAEGVASRLRQTGYHPVLVLL